MVNFLTVVDSNDNRRQAYVNAIKPLVSPVEGLITSACSNESFSSIWAAGTWTPISYVTDGEGAAIVFGDAIVGPGTERLNAEQLRQRWDSSKLQSALDGFHAAVVYNPQNGLTVGADLLGVFPIYYHTSDEVALVGSSPELFQYHPCFETKFNPKGLVGIFLTKGLFEGQTLLCGVKRLAPGHLLMWHPNKPATEALQFKLPVSTKYFNLNIAEQVEVLDTALNEAVSRHVLEDTHHCLMLSGGLDSRMLGGYLRQKKYKVTAFTDGLPTDDDMKYAKKVANTLSFKHARSNIGYKNYPYFADLSATWLHLSDGFTGMTVWGYYKHLRKVAKRVVSGSMGNGIFAGLISQARPASRKQVSFEALFRYINRWALRPRVLRRLLKKEYFDDLVTETLDRIRRVYESYSRLEFQRVRCFGLHHRIRFHGASLVWLLSLGSWPVLPFADRKILEIMGGMPIEAQEDRYLQKELLCRKFPKLARLPIGGTTFDTTPLVPAPRHKALQQIHGNIGIWKIKQIHTLRNVLWIKLRGERRYWSRSFYFNSPGWKAIRKKVEPHIRLTSQILEENVIDKLVPPPTAGDLYIRRVSKPAGITDTSSIQTLSGFALWLQKHRDVLNKLTNNKQKNRR